MAVSFDVVRHRAAGDWLAILKQLAPVMVEAVDKSPRHVTCPIHGGKDGFRLYKDANQTGGGICNTCGAFPDGFALLAWANNWSLSQALQAVADHLGIDGTQPPAKAAVNSTPVIEDKDRQQSISKRKRDALKAVWQGLVPLSDISAGPARAYLSKRGLSACLEHLPRDLLFHPSLEYWHDGKQYGHYPALVAVVRALDGSGVSLHRTYLDADGNKASLPTVKKLMPPAISGATRGAAIRLYTINEDVILAEGIETAIALHLALNKPCWACVSAGGLEAVQLPAFVKRVIIGADNDANGAGQKAAQTLTARLLKEHRHIQVKTIMPEHTGVDWLDVYNDKETTA